MVGNYLLQPFIGHQKAAIAIIGSEWVIKFNSLFGDSGHQGPYSPHKPCNYSLYIGIIIFPHIDNAQSTGYN